MNKACVITTGSEIIEGIILDQNSKWLSSKLTSLGWRISKIISVDDDPSALKNALMCSIKDCELIVITGGLGPTKDDITRNVVADFFGRELVYDSNLYEKIKIKVMEFAGKVVESIKNEAMVVDGAVAIPNDVGSAPGQFLEVDGKTIILLPGPPDEMKNVFSKVEKELTLSVGLYSKVLKFYGIKESILEDKLKDIIYKYPEIKVAFQADYIKGITLRLTSQDKNTDIIESLVRKIYENVGEYIYADDNREMEETVVRLLKEKKKTLAVAESCTGGLLAGKIVNVPGSSKVFKGGIIAYDNSIKVKFLGVNKSTLKRYGAVSEECVSEMLAGTIKSFDVDYALAVSGIASPSGGDEGKPVGTVYIGVKGRNIEKIEKFYFKRERNVVRYKSVYTALDMLRRVIGRG